MQFKANKSNYQEDKCFTLKRSLIKNSQEMVL